MHTRSCEMAKQNRGANVVRFPVRVRPVNKRWAEARAKAAGVSLSLWIDRLLDGLRATAR